MKISTKGRYGVRIMFELAMHYNKGFITVKAISRKQDLSEKYIEQIIGTLNRAGLVYSQRGVLGGYKLIAPPDKITIGQILRVTEGELDLTECVTDNYIGCTKKTQCIANDVWRKLKEAMEEVVDNVFLSDLLSNYYDNCNYDCVV